MKIKPRVWKNLPLSSKVLTNDKSCNFFTNFVKLELFHKFHDIIAPLVRRRFRPVSQTQTKRKFITTPKKMGKKEDYLQKMNFIDNDEIETWATNNGFSSMLQREVALIHFFLGYDLWQSTSRHLFLSPILKLFLQHPQIVFDALRT